MTLDAYTSMFAESTDFYVTGGTLRPDAPCYVRRAADDELREALLRGEFCYVLTSRQMGKSSLMVQTAACLRREGLTAVLLDLSALGHNLSVEQWYYGLLAAVGQQTGLRRELQAFWREHPQLSPLQRWLAAVREVVLPAREGVVLFIDEIDTVRSLPFSTDELFAAIRECYNRRAEEPLLRRLSFCLLGVATPSDLIQDVHTTPFNIGRRVELRDFSPEEAAPLARGFTGPGRETRALMRRILYWTGGHPYLTQRLCKAASERSSGEDEGGRVKDEALILQPSELDRLVREMFLTSGAREQEDNLLFVREQLLDGGGDLAALLETYERVLAGRLVPDDPESRIAGVLRLSGAVRSEAERLRPRNRIYAAAFDRRWARSQMPDAEARRQRAAFFRGLRRAAALSAMVVVVTAALAAAAVGNERRAVANERQARDLARELETTLAAKDTALRELRAALEQVQRERNAAREQAERARRAEHREAGERVKAVVARRQAELSGKHAEQQRRTALARRAEAESARAAARRRQQEAEEQRDRSRDRLIRAQVAEGWRRADDGDLPGALLWFVEALEREEGHPERERNHRLRIASVLAQCPGLTASWKLPGRGSLAAFSPDGERLLTTTSEGSVQLRSAAHGELLGRPLEGLGTVLEARFQDGRWRVVTGRETTASVWDAATGQRFLGPLPHGGRVSCARFSADGRLLLTGSDDGTIRLWDASTGRPLTPPLPCDRNVWRCDLSADGALAAAMTADGDTRVWDLRGEPRRLPYGYGTASRVRLSRDGAYLVAAGAAYDNAAQLWITRTGRHASPRLLHDREVVDVAFSPDLSAVLTTSVDGTARLWNPETGRMLIPPLRHQGTVQDGTFSPDGARILTASEDGTARVWNAATGLPLTPPLSHPAPLVRAVFSPDGRRVLTICVDGTARLWDLAVADPASFPLRLKEGVNLTALSRDGRIAATGGDTTQAPLSPDAPVRIWDVATQQPRTPALSPSGKPVHHLSLSADGALLLLVERGNTVRILDAESGKQAGPILQCPTTVFEACFSEDARRVVTGGADTARVWDRSTGRIVVELLQSPKQHVRRVRCSPDGERILTRTRGHVLQVWDARTGAPLTASIRETEEIADLTFSPDGNCFISAGLDGAARLYQTGTGRLLQTLRHPRPILSARFSPDSRRVITASSDKSARVWSAATGVPLTRPLVHPAAVWSAGFSPDGGLTYTACEDGTARVWDSVTGEPVTPPLQVGHGVVAAAFAPDGGSLSALARDGTTARWPLAPLLAGVDELRLLAGYLAGSRLDDAGGLVALSPEELRKGEAVYRASLEQRAAPEREKVLAWRRREALVSEATGQWEIAAAHLDRLVEAVPGEWMLHHRRAHARSEAGRWEAAAGDWQATMDYGREDRIFYYRRALSRLAGGDAEGYRAACARMLDRYEGSEDRRELDMTAWTCALGPLTPEQRARALTIVERLLQQEPEHREWRHTRAALLYRAGRHAEGLREIEEVLRLRGTSGEPPDQLYRAMLLASLGRGEEARSTLEAARAQIDHLRRVRLLRWEDRAEYGLFLPEAEALARPDAGSGKR